MPLREGYASKLMAKFSFIMICPGSLHIQKQDAKTKKAHGLLHLLSPQALEQPVHRLRYLLRGYTAVVDEQNASLGIFL